MGQARGQVRRFEVLPILVPVMRPKKTIRRASPESWPGEGLAEQPERAMEKTLSAFWLLSASKSYPITASTNKDLLK
jgi:hypothetical protein